ncbi:MAG: YdcH family protein [Alcaligenaceae bacterium]|nr:YdcH family protein [Alcaligenaceae bacterium]
MFPEYRDLIAKLRQEDSRFEKLFDQHNELDHQIIRMEKNAATAIHADLDIDQLKKEKLALKDEIYGLLLKANAQQ